MCGRRGRVLLALAALEKYGMRGQPWAAGQPADDPMIVRKYGASCMCKNP